MHHHLRVMIDSSGRLLALNNQEGPFAAAFHRCADGVLGSALKLLDASIVCNLAAT